MNERIQLLADQCYYRNNCNLELFNKEKFAELIVRQCAEVGLDSVEDGDDLDAIMKRVHNNILKHFGVEE
jgi:hypothetical protein